MQTVDRNGLKIFHSPDLRVEAEPDEPQPLEKIFRITVNEALLHSRPVINKAYRWWLSTFLDDALEKHVGIRVLVIEKIRNNVIRIIQNPAGTRRKTLYAKTNIIVRYRTSLALQVHDDPQNIDLYKLYPAGDKVAIVNDTDEVITISNLIHLNNRLLLKIDDEKKEEKPIAYFLPVSLGVRIIRFTKVTEVFFKLQLSLADENPVINRYINTSWVFLREHGETGYLLVNYLPERINIQKIVAHIFKLKSRLLFIEEELDKPIFDQDLSHLLYNGYGAAVLSKKDNHYTKFRYITPLSIIQGDKLVMEGPSPENATRFSLIADNVIIFQEANRFKIFYHPAHLITILKADEPCPETIQEICFEKVSENLNWMTDILKGIFHNLTEEEKVYSSRVCKQWHRSVKKINEEAMNSIVTLFKKFSWRKVKSTGKTLNFVIQ